MRKLYAAIDAMKCQDTRLRLFGWYFGFPKCCTNQFVGEFDSIISGRETPDRRSPPHSKPGDPGHHVWTGTGFIPCSMCVPAARADFKRFVAEHITPNRRHPEPFPKDDCYEQPFHLAD